MRRMPDGVTIRYSPGDRVKVLVDDVLCSGTVLFPPEIRLLRRIDENPIEQTFYKIRLDTREQVRVSAGAIVKQADTGGVGTIEHLETF